MLKRFFNPRTSVGPQALREGNGSNQRVKPLSFPPSFLLPRVRARRCHDNNIVVQTQWSWAVPFVQFVASLPRLFFCSRPSALWPWGSERQRESRRGATVPCEQGVPIETVFQEPPLIVKSRATGRRIQTKGKDFPPPRASHQHLFPSRAGLSPMAYLHPPLVLRFVRLVVRFVLGGHPRATVLFLRGLYQSG